MTNRLRKQSCHTARRARHERRRAEKREAARSHRQTPTKAQRRTIPFPATWFQPAHQWTRRAA